MLVSEIKSQITITSSQMPGSSDTIRYSTAPLSTVGNYTTTGSNYVWDFSGLTPNGQKLREFKPSFSTPYAFFFLPPKYGEKIADTVSIPVISNSLTITDVYNFYKKTTSVFSVEGLGVKLNGIPVPNFNSDEDELYNFPLSYTDRDSTTFAFSTVTNTSVPFTYKKRGYRITEVDGWGSVTTPYGTANCLRVVTTQYSRDSIYTTKLPSPFNKFGFPNYQRSYQWLTLGEKIPYFEVTGNVVFGVFNPTQARYRDHIQSFVGMQETNANIALSVYPNPANNQLVIITEQGAKSINVKLTDLQGKVVFSDSLNNNGDVINQHIIDVSKVAKGLYVLTLFKDGNQQTLKISIQ